MSAEFKPNTDRIVAMATKNIMGVGRDGSEYLKGITVYQRHEDGSVSMHKEYLGGNGTVDYGSSREYSEEEAEKLSLDWAPVDSTPADFHNNSDDLGGGLY